MSATIRIIYSVYNCIINWNIDIKYIKKIKSVYGHSAVTKRVHRRKMSNDIYIYISRSVRGWPKISWYLCIFWLEHSQIRQFHCIFGQTETLIKYIIKLVWCDKQYVKFIKIVWSTDAFIENFKSVLYGKTRLRHCPNLS